MARIVSRCIWYAEFDIAKTLIALMSQEFPGFVHLCRRPHFPDRAGLPAPEISVVFGSGALPSVTSVELSHANCGASSFPLAHRCRFMRPFPQLRWSRNGGVTDDQTREVEPRAHFTNTPGRSAGQG